MRALFLSFSLGVFVKSAKPNTIHRRHLLHSSLITGAWFASGCSPSSTDIREEVPGSSRQLVKLRVLFVGDSADADVIKRGWESVSDHPVDLKVLPLQRSDPTELRNQLDTAYLSADVAIVPLVVLPTAFHAQWIIPLTGGEFDQLRGEAGELYASVRNAAANYAGQTLSIPLGSGQLCLVSSDPLEQVDSWLEYDQLVQEVEGSASEPTAPGWAAGSFLARCAGDRDWLFSGETFEPRLTQSQYEEALTLMVETCARYRVKEQAPEQIWSAVTEGNLRAGIGFPDRRGARNLLVPVQALPGSSNASGVLLDSFSPILTLPSSCRQTLVAKQFMVWLSGGEGSSSVRSQVAGMGNVRSPSVISQRGPTSASSSYDELLASVLTSPVTLAGLQLIGGEAYYHSLDQQIQRAIRGDLEPIQALSAVCDDWNRITDSVGRDDQVRAWMRANGMRG